MRLRLSPTASSSDRQAFTDTGPADHRRPFRVQGAVLRNQDVNNPPPPVEPPRKDPKAERLAQALRDNLRRRKAPPPSAGEDGGLSDS